MERLLQLTLSGSVMALLLLILRRLFGKRLPTTVYYYAWLLVLLRFLLPLPGLVPTGAPASQEPLPRHLPYESSYYEDAEIPVSDDNAAAPVTNAAAAIPPQAQEPEAVPAEPPSVSAPAAKRSVDWRSEKLWLSVWSLGAALCFAFYALSYAVFTARLRRSFRRPDAFTRAAYAGIPGRKIALWRSAAVKTPLTYGVLFPKIVLPAGYYDELELKNIFAHELTHVRRCDTLYKWLAAGVLSLHWFNPLGLLIRREIDRACELSCDEMLLRSMGREEKLAYGNTLLNMAASSALPAGVVATTFSTEKKNLKERLEQIMSYRKSGASVLAAVLALLLLAGCGLAAGPKATDAAELSVEPSAGMVVKVSTVDEFLAALGPDRTIELAAGDYALSEASNYGEDSGSAYYEWTREYDGPAIEIHKADNLVISGEGADKVTLTAEPRYANVLRFVSCDNLTVAGLTAGHTQEPGLCSGGVLRFEACRNCTVRQCGLFGCGTIGVWASDCAGLTVEDTAIYECSYGAAALYSCRSVRIRGGEVYDCGRRPNAGDAVNLFDCRNSSDVAVSGVVVHDNSAQMLLHSVYSQGVLFLSNEVKDNAFMSLFGLDQYSPVVDGCRFENNSDYSVYMYNSGVFAVDLSGEQLVGDAIEKMALRELDPESVVPAAAPLPEGVEIAPGGEVSVKTVDEFLAAIGPERTIYLAGDSFDLSTASSYGSVGAKYYYWHETFDGPELVIDGVKGLTIRAASDNPKAVTLAAVPRYANVLVFKNCEDIALVGFTAGHTQEPGSCSGGVLFFSECHGVTVDSMRLYGCGILGLDCSWCTGVRTLRTEIYECSQGAVNMSHTDGIDFIDCDIHDVPNPAFSFFMSSDKTWNGEALSGSAYDIVDGEIVESSEGAGGSLEAGDVLRMSIDQLDEFLLMPEYPAPLPWPESGTELAFAQTVRQLIAEGDWEKLADRISFPMLLFTEQGNYRVESREDFLKMDLDSLMPESFRERIAADSLEAMSANAFGNGFAQNAVTFCHMEDKDGADVILIVAIIVRE